MCCNDSPLLQKLAIVALYHSFAVGHMELPYYLENRSMSWVNAQRFCQRHYIDLAVLTSEEQYSSLLNATAATRSSYWLGLQRQTIASQWKWVSGEELVYDHWLRKDNMVLCASFAAYEEKEDKLLARVCAELHKVACQGPVSPRSVRLDSVETRRVNLSWAVPPSMQTTPHYYSATVCAQKCQKLLFPFPGGAPFMRITISNLTTNEKYSIKISACVARPDNLTGREVIYRSNPVFIYIKTGDPETHKKLMMLLFEVLKCVFLVLPLWIVYYLLINDRCPCSYNIPKMIQHQLLNQQSTVVWIQALTNQVEPTTEDKMVDRNL